MRTFESVRCDQLNTLNRLDIRLNKWQQKPNTKDLQLEMAQTEKQKQKSTTIIQQKKDTN